MTTNQPEPPSNPDQQNPQDRTLESVEEELRNLQEENSRLREKLKDLDIIQELLVHRVAEKSQNKILALAVAIATIFSAFLVLLGEGIIKDSANKYIENAVPTVLENKIDGLLESEDFQKKIAEKTAEKIITNDKLIQIIATEVANLLQERGQFTTAVEVQDKLSQVAEEIKVKSPELAEALKGETSAAVYFVIAGSSIEKIDLQNERERVKRENASLFAPGGPYAGTKICDPKRGNRLFALVIAENVTLSQAKEIVKQATESGFRPDTYPLRRDKAFFDCPS